MFPEVGQNPYAPYVAYGDDSSYEEILLYGFVICERNHVAKLERDVINLKKDFGIPYGIPIHMKNLLSGQYRQKNGIYDFERPRQAMFFRKVVDILNRNKCIFRYSYARIPESGKLFPENSEDGQIRLIENHKALIHQMAAGCFVPYAVHERLVLTANDFEVFLSHDSTKVKFVSEAPSKQAHFLSEILIPTTNPPESFARLKPGIEYMKDNIFLQFADAVVYILAHALSSKCNDEMFNYQAGRIKYFVQHIADFNVPEAEAGSAV